jgi:hypothetical protein
MNHSWVKDNDFVPDFPFMEKHVCRTCKCIRYKSVRITNGFVISNYEYIRNGIDFRYRPDCIDWSDNSIVESDDIMMFNVTR